MRAARAVRLQRVAPQARAARAAATEPTRPSKPFPALSRSHDGTARRAVTAGVQALLQPAVLSRMAAASVPLVRLQEQEPQAVLQAWTDPARPPRVARWRHSSTTVPREPSEQMAALVAVAVVARACRAILVMPMPTRQAATVETVALQVPLVGMHLEASLPQQPGAAALEVVAVAVAAPSPLQDPLGAKELRAVLGRTGS